MEPIFAIYFCTTILLLEFNPSIVDQAFLQKDAWTSQPILADKMYLVSRYCGLTYFLHFYQDIKVTYKVVF